MNTLLLRPTDTLFFRDGRPMGGALAGHGAAWPLPSALNAALHAALWRAGEVFDDVHVHRPGRSSNRPEGAERTRKFGSLVTVGPFPVNEKGSWFFPRPADAQQAGTTKVTLRPTASTGASSLPEPLRYPVGNSQPPTKEKPEGWWSASAWQEYLVGGQAKMVLEAKSHFLNDADFSDTEHNIGIGINPDTGTQDGTNIYSAHSLRLREGWQLGTLAEAMDKAGSVPGDKRDLIAALFPNRGSETPIIVGGQQRICTAQRETPATLPLPTGAVITGKFIKWVLLTPAIFPQIDDHPGGWLPSWISHTDGQVMLKAGDTDRREREGREVWRQRIAAMQPIPAKLVAAITGKPIPVTGYALPNADDPDRTEGGAKPTHLAVPAGAVYYFEAEGTDDAEKQANAQALAAALNWHGSTPATAIKNRRSTLMGEKGFGLGVCGTWDFHQGNRP